MAPGVEAAIARVLSTARPIEPDPALLELEDVLRARYGQALDAIVLYGSYLRGQRDSLIDCYALLDTDASRPEPTWQLWLEHALPPNVFNIALPDSGARAKCAVMTTAVLTQAVTHDFHCYFWARFAQPCAVLFSRDPSSTRRVAHIRTQAIAHCLTEAGWLAQAQHDATPAALDLWRLFFQHTYAAELRAESTTRGTTLIDFDQSYYEALATAWLATTAVPARHNAATPLQFGQRIAARWRRRRLQGKALSMVRLLKAAFTFNDGLAYLLWKVERHSGVHLHASERQKRFPLIFAWPLVWRAWREGGFH